MKKGAFRNVTKFTGVSCEFCDISRNTFFTEHLLATASAGHKPMKDLKYKTIRISFPYIENVTEKFLISTCLFL